MQQLRANHRLDDRQKPGSSLSNIGSPNVTESLESLAFSRNLVTKTRQISRAAPTELMRQIAFGQTQGGRATVRAGPWNLSFPQRLEQILRLRMRETVPGFDGGMTGEP